MVVDDDDDIRETLAILLMEAGFDVIEATHGQHALDLMAAGSRPALILLDQTMPVLSGRGFREAQLANDNIAGIPVLLMTASSAVNDLVDELRPTAYTRKPVGFDELLSAIHALAPSA